MSPDHVPPPRLPTEYQRTTYFAETPLGVIRLRVGLADLPLAALLARAGTRHWAYVTAWNPGGPLLTRPENDARHAELLAAVQGHPAYPGWGVGDVGDHMEQSLLIVGIANEDALALAKRFGQLAIVAGAPGHEEVPELVDTRG